MDFSALTDRELTENLQNLLRHPERNESADKLQAAVQALQVHRMELEMQNRALREMQVELEYSVHRYADLYDHLPIGYLTLDQSDQIREANATACEWLGRERARLVGAHLRSFLSSEDSRRLRQHLESCAAEGEAGKLVVELRTPTGEIAAQLSSRAVQSQGERVIHTALTDITELKRTERALEEVNREQEAFNYSISHDLRGPLLTISGFARILNADHAAQLADEPAQMLRRIEHAALRLDEMLKRLLELSRLSRQTVGLEPVNLAEIVDQVLLEHRCLIQYQKAEITVEPPLPSVLGSATMLSQVLANLLTNALKYTARDVPPRVRIFAEERARTVVLKVRDQGIGIPAQHLGRIFNVFERLHGEQQYSGSGVGLAIVRRAVERMGGRVWVESEVDRGTCFSVELPKPD